MADITLKRINDLQRKQMDQYRPKRPRKVVSVKVDRSKKEWDKLVELAHSRSGVDYENS